MKKIFLIVAALAAAFTGVSRAQTNSFTVPLGTNVVLQPAITGTVVTVQRIVIDNTQQQAMIWLSNVAKPIVVKGAGFAALKAAVGPSFRTAMAAYIQANPPGQ